MMDLNKFNWIRKPLDCTLFQDRLEVITKPHTDLWQRTYYHFRNDNAPVFETVTDKKYFSFVVRCDFAYKKRFDQCGIAVYLDSENWLKASIEYENPAFCHLGSVVTNNGYSDWATAEISSDLNGMWYRLSRREDDFCIENSTDGIKFKQMRICHLSAATNRDVSFGVYACSPEDSSFKAVFSEFKLLECQWKAHDGQQPDE